MQNSGYTNVPDDPNTISDDTICAILKDMKSEALWIATRGGLSKFHKRTQSFKHYRNDPNDPKSIGSNDVCALHQDTAARLWIATNGGGLNRFDRQTETFIRYTMENGFPTNDVRTILEDDNGNLWMGTGSGIVKFDPATGNSKRFTKEDGLQGNTFFPVSRLKTRDGQMWFGGLRGANSFYPQRIKDNPYIPPIVMTSFSQGGEELKFGKALTKVDEIDLSWQNNFFSFEFAALNYTQPQKNRYAYKLEGLDKHWNNTGTKRFGRYTNLPGGTYILRIRGSNNDGVWNEEGLSVTLNVSNPPWKTWWAYTFYFLSFLTIILIYTRSQTVKLEKERNTAHILKKAEEKYRGIFENALEGMFQSSINGKLIKAS